MSDYANVEFKGLDHVFHIPSTLAEFSIGGHDFSIKWYGTLIAVGFLLALLFCTRLCKRKNISLDNFFDAVIWGTVMGILGARAYYVLFSWDYYSQHPGDIWRIQDGGLAIYGGIIAALITVLIYSAVKKVHVLDFFDLASVGFLMGQGVGRWGNFTNQEAFGTNTDLPWGMTSEKVRLYLMTHQGFFEEHHIDVDPMGYVHPTFLYESVWCIIGFVILYIMFSKHRKYRGQIFLGYLAWYGLERAVVEGLRTDSLYLGSTDIRISQWLSAALCLVSAVLFVIQAVRYRDKPVLEPYPQEEPATESVTEKGTEDHGKEEG